VKPMPRGSRFIETSAVIDMTAQISVLLWNPCPRG
jgi:hypothetical protein